MNFELQAALIGSLFAIDAPAFGGVCLRSSADPVRDQWLQLLRNLLPADAPLRKIPSNIADSRLLGGIDLAATLRASRPVAEQGVLASVDQGVLVIAMAERLTAHTAALLCTALEGADRGVGHDGMALPDAARFGIVAFDEGLGNDESMPHCLQDRCAFLLDFAAVNARTLLIPEHDRAQIDAARDSLSRVTVDGVFIQALCATAMTLGAGSVRASLFAVRAARALAALDGRVAVTQEDAETAGRLVLAPRASTLPESNTGERSNDNAQPPPSAPSAGNSSTPGETQPAPLESATPQVAADVQQIQDLVLAATRSAISSGLLQQLQANGRTGRAVGRAARGRSGALRKGGTSGRPTGVVRAGIARSRVNIIETLRAAAPWQSIRNRAAGDATGLQIRSEDLRLTRYKERSRTLTIFAVDASGSSALNRLAEAKGAAELLLADCYIRRDQVAVIAFRGRTADVLLQPTRSLVRAKRSLAALPGGGGTPLAAAIDAAALIASQAQRRGETPIVVVLSDGRGNVARDGRVGREAGRLDALSAAQAFGGARLSALFVDTAPRPDDHARDLARRMKATYVPLPFADAQSISRLIGAVRSPRPARP